MNICINIDISIYCYLIKHKAKQKHLLPFYFRFNKIDRFIKIHNKIRYLVLFDYSYCDKICDKIK